MARGKGEGSIYKDGRGLWTAEVELPTHNGTRRRKKIRSKDKKVVLVKLREFQKELAISGDLPTRAITVSQWMDEWFTTIASVKNRPKTLDTYRGLIEREIKPALGTTRLDKLMPVDVRQMTNGIVEKGLSSSTAKQVHRILVVALKYAERDGHVTRNVALLVDAPRPAKPQLKALTFEEGIRVLEAAADEPWGSLWAAVLLTGARKGELLGLEIDRVTDIIEVSWQLQRLSWEHGCGGTCGRKRGFDCRKRKITAPADWENRRLAGSLWLTRPKSKSGWRVIPLVEPLKSIMERHILTTANEPNPYGLVWRMPNGSPIDPNHLVDKWHELLGKAGVTDVRLHDGRHTAVDLLYEAGVHEDLIREIVGHSARETTRGYKRRGNDKRLREAMLQLSALIGQPTGERSGILALDE